MPAEDLSSLCAWIRQAHHDIKIIISHLTVARSHLSSSRLSNSQTIVSGFDKLTMTSKLSSLISQSQGLVLSLLNLSSLSAQSPFRTCQSEPAEDSSSFCVWIRQAHHDIKIIISYLTVVRSHLSSLTAQRPAPFPHYVSLNLPKTSRTIVSGFDKLTMTSKLSSLISKSQSLTSHSIASRPLILSSLELSLLSAQRPFRTMSV